MTTAIRSAGLILKLQPGAAGAFAAAARTLLGLDTTPLFPNLASGGQALGARADGEWVVARATGGGEEEGGWGEAHAALDRLGLAAAAPGVVYAEPDLWQQFPAVPPGDGALAARGQGTADAQDPALPRGPEFAWFLRPGYADLRAARDLAGDAPVTILHADTGYDPGHETVPEGLEERFARDFTGDAERKGARDPGGEGALRNPGHGTGTLSILAGDRVPELGNDYLGGAPRARVVPVRVANAVVLFRTSALARAFDYALRPYDGPDAAHPGATLPPVDVVTLSMGGVASKAWAEAVNACYEAGVCVVAAAGNNFALGPLGVPTRFIVFPARFRRVIAACGIMADWRPYFGLATGKMQGNWGPASKMSTALAAFTPNMPWAEYGAARTVDMNGAGTSAATPQVAAAAALWIARHRASLQPLPGWRRVEAVRNALFSTAVRPDDPRVAEKLGRGFLQARAALEVGVPERLTQTPRDKAGLALLRVLLGLGAAADPRQEMYAVEASQLLQLPVSDGRPNPYEELVPDPDEADAGLPPERLRRFLEALREHPRASAPLRAHLDRVREALGAGHAPPLRPPPPATQEPPPAPAAARPPPAPPPPQRRRLAAFAFDPSVAQRLDTRDIATVTLQVPWEPLAPGPVGEYLEVIDADPSSDCFYAPVDLDHPHLLAEGGLRPSVGTPQFHQQMAYAVAQLTIERFERALGRKVLWSPAEVPGRPWDDSVEVRRLRIYPHALREANAYYSPARKALLLGYFCAAPEGTGDHLPSGFVFTALSQDIVAHETAHALLDGMHRTFGRPTNPDMQAMHEAFADVVALLQHFTTPEIVRDQIARTRGRIRDQASLLGELASEFGRALGTRGALRDAIGTIDPATGAWRPHAPDPAEYEEAVEPHARGAILVAAVFDAFLSIYERRSRDLLRIATGGTGVLPDGALHPDLVDRLADEAARAAEHVLVMCIRALDYAPCTDMTFGEYLRAIVTADHDTVPDDALGYRVAFVEAFRRRGIYPRDVRALSEDALLWRGPRTWLGEQPSPELTAVLAALGDHARSHLDEPSRSLLFQKARALRAMLHQQLAAVLARPATGAADAALLGLRREGGGRFEVHAARFSERVGPDGHVRPECIVELLQREKDVRGRRGAVAEFEGGSTLVLGLRDGPGGAVALRYVIRKSVTSQARIDRQAAFEERRAGALAWNPYFGERLAAAAGEPFAAAHRS